MSSNTYGYIADTGPTQAYGSNNGVFDPADINDLIAENKWSGVGTLELIQTQSVSGVAQADFTSLGSYNVHFLTLNNFTPTTDSRQINARLSTDSGTSFITSGYQFAIQNGYSDDTFSEINSTSYARMRIAGAVGNATNETGSGYIYFYNLLDSTKYSFVTSHFSYMHPNSTLGGGFTFGSQVLPTAAEHNAIRVYPQSGNFSADISLYGIRYS